MLAKLLVNKSYNKSMLPIGAAGEHLKCFRAILQRRALESVSKVSKLAGMIMAAH